MKWEVATVQVAGNATRHLNKLNDYLLDGWEPFSASASVAGHIFYLRRKVSRESD